MSHLGYATSAFLFAVTVVARLILYAGDPFRGEHFRRLAAKMNKAANVGGPEHEDG
jgi:hypothetical protein